MGWAQGFLFDLDGTLVDSFPAIAASANHVRGLRGLPALPHETVHAAVGNGLRVLMERLVPAGATEENAAAFMAHHPGALAAGGCVPYPEVRETLAALRAAGHSLAVCSNKPLALTKLVLAATGLAEPIAAAFGPESVGKPKPAPDMLHAALAALAVPAAAALYVGDMVVDIETARAAGVRCWAIPTGPQAAELLRDAGPDRVLRNFGEVLEAAAPRESGHERRSP
jgi:2-phosphoglycolate phosphatase